MADCTAVTPSHWKWVTINDKPFSLITNVINCNVMPFVIQVLLLFHVFIQVRIYNGYFFYTTNVISDCMADNTE